MLSKAWGRLVKLWGRRQRLPLNRRLRLGGILALALVAAIPAYLAFVAFRTPTAVTYQVPLWRWAHWGNWDYTVLLKRNTLFDTRELGPGLTYYEALVQGIHARFSYAFATTAPAQIQGWYEVTAELAAGKLLTERTPVVPPTPFPQTPGTSLTLELELPLDRARFRDRLASLSAETGVRAAAEPTVTFTAHVEVTATAQARSTKQVLEPTLIVPLSGETFTLSGKPSLTDTGVIPRPHREVYPGVGKWRRNYLVATGVAGLLPLLFARFTLSPPPPPVGVARQARRLCRQHRKRLARLRPGEPVPALPVEGPPAEVVALASMDDLARVSEELLKPIIYAAPAQPGGPHLFFIVDGPTRYQFRLGPPPG